MAVAHSYCYDLLLMLIGYLGIGSIAIASLN